MAEFWEEAFSNKKEMWGMAPAKSAWLTKDFFIKNSIKKVLIPGIGYGRNAQPFLETGMTITGIEISKTAIELAQNHYGTEMTIYHGSVTDMPFDSEKYEGVYCYALIHLLDNKERKKLILNCYNQLTENGCMVFTAITKKAPNFRKGEFISKDRYEFHKGVQIFYYDEESVKEEFEKYGLIEMTEIDENQPMYLIKCQKV
ncbi:class I SAM-dependent methyltransferase [Reichenbachiella agarivorans]|uniref:Class I SAM-dependent methyltransferase n=1 Tax=Reichenbachiella agarivorans TaxID=2979464 RepID=A0ABY6CKK6_9BACT|nr:class I SAM-dependent methyltransferase [Reichenbachiella agarivorans]UXP31056.1 class I SAM-dependent methyltransferase [Reichenbachiella agarivorans]